MRKVLDLLVIGVLGFVFGYLLAIVLTLPTIPKEDTEPKPEVKKPITLIPVAVIDSGFDEAALKKSKVKLCPKGHYDATYEDYTIGYDWTKVQHGTKMAALVSKYSKGRACLVLIKALDHDPYIQNIVYINRALKHLILMKDYVKIASLSYSGPQYNQQERVSMMQLSYSNKVAMFVAAGNDDIDLDLNCSIYPACYRAIDRKVVVSADNVSHFNRGSVVNLWENGLELGIGGTSIAAAIAAGKAAYELSENAR